MNTTESLNQNPKTLREFVCQHNTAIERTITVGIFLFLLAGLAYAGRDHGFYFAMFSVGYGLFLNIAGYRWGHADGEKSANQERN